MSNYFRVLLGSLTLLLGYAFTFFPPSRDISNNAAVGILLCLVAGCVFCTMTKEKQ